MNPAANLDHETREELGRLTQPPPVAWPTVALLIVCAGAITASVAASVTRIIPLWAGLLINTTAVYLLFSVAHDSIHRAISSNLRINDWCGRIAATFMSPGSTLGLFRWSHIQHHRYTSGPGDPDNWLHGGRTWTLPLRWLVIDFYYLLYVIRSDDRIARRYLPSTLTGLGVAVVLALILWVLGYWPALLMLWLIPTRVQAIMLGFTFFWLPHVPHDVTGAEDPYRATTIRRGHEWLLTPLLQYHNYHLIHHLYPRTPFYNHLRVWRLLAPELQQHTLSVQQGFGIHPHREAPVTDSSG